MSDSFDTINDERLSFVVTKQTPPTRFLASLSDGRTVIQDNRPGERAAWARLAEWMKVNTSISVTGIRLQGPKGEDIKMPPNQKGYFFGNKHQAVWGGGQSTYIAVGFYDGNQIEVVWHRQPKFDHAMAEKRTVQNAGFFLIQNP